MSLRKSVLMLSNTSGNYKITGDKIRSDGWWGYTDGIHTVQVTYSNLYGQFGIEGTLSINPTENDWFPIHLSDGVSQGPYASFNFESGSRAYTFVGNFVFLRAKLHREDPIITDPYVIETLGTIDKVLLAM